MRIDYSYLILIIILLFIIFSKATEKRKFKWAAWITFLFIGLRACVVGADTYLYTLGYMGFDYYKGKELEPLYRNVYVPILSSILKFEPFFIFVNTICSLAPIYFLIKKYSEMKAFSVGWFFIYGIYISYFVALRQILGLSLLLFGVLYVIKDQKRKWLVYTLFAILAYGFHTSTSIATVLFVVAYFVRVESRKLILSLILSSALLGIIFQAFDIGDIFNWYLNMNTGFTTERLNAYMLSDHSLDAHETSGYIYMLRYTWLGLFIYYFMDQEKLNHWFSKIFLIAIFIYNLFYNVDMITRMNLAFDIFSLVVITWAFGERYVNIMRKHKIIKIIPILVFLWFFQSYIRFHIDYDLDELSKMHPYYFFWEDYSSHPSITRF